MTLHVPSLLATETAKCSRAANALRTCARDRDRAHLRGQQAAEEAKEAYDTVEVCPRALAADPGWGMWDGKYGIEARPTNGHVMC